MASSIADVFQEAANKVEIDKKETEKRYLDNVKQLEGIIAKVTRKWKNKIISFSPFRKI